MLKGHDQGTQIKAMLASKHEDKWIIESLARSHQIVTRWWFEIPLTPQLLHVQNSAVYLFAQVPKLKNNTRFDPCIMHGPRFETFGPCTLFPCKGCNHPWPADASGGSLHAESSQNTQGYIKLEQSAWHPYKAMLQQGATRSPPGLTILTRHSQHDLEPKSAITHC